MTTITDEGRLTPRRAALVLGVLLGRLAGVLVVVAEILLTRLLHGKYGAHAHLQELADDEDLSRYIL